MKTAKIIKVNESRHMVITPKFRVSFPSVFTARSFQEGQPKHFELDMIFDSKEDFKKPYQGQKVQTVSMVRAVSQAKVDQWGPDQDKWPKMEYSPFKNGDNRTNKEGEIFKGYEGKWYVSAKCGEKYPPKVVDRAGNPLTEETFYGGCYAIAHLIARPYAFGKNFGVRFLLSALQKVGEGERFGGFKSDVFDVSEEGEAFSEDETESMEEDF